MHAYERFPRRRRQSLPGAQANAQAPVHARTPRRRDPIQLLQRDARLAQGARYREGHVALVSFLCVERVDATERLVDRRLLEDDVGQEAAVTRDDGGARVVCRTGGSACGRRVARCRRRTMKRRTCRGLEAQDEERPVGGSGRGRERSAASARPQRCEERLGGSWAHRRAGTDAVEVEERGGAELRLMKKGGEDRGRCARDSAREMRVVGVCWAGRAPRDTTRRVDAGDETRRRRAPSPLSLPPPLPSSSSSTASRPTRCRPTSRTTLTQPMPSSAGAALPPLSPTRCAPPPHLAFISLSELTPPPLTRAAPPSTLLRPLDLLGPRPAAPHPLDRGRRRVPFTRRREAHERAHHARGGLAPGAHEGPALADPRGRDACRCRRRRGAARGRHGGRRRRRWGRGALLSRAPSVVAQS